MSDPTNPAPTGPTTPAEPTHNPAPAAPQTAPKENPVMKNIWPFIAIAALVVLGILGWKWLDSSSTASVPPPAFTAPVVLPNGTVPQQIDPVTGQPLINNQIDIQIDVTGWADVNDKNCPANNCREDNAGRIFVYAQPNGGGECKIVCWQDPRKGTPRCAPKGNQKAKPELATLPYRHRDQSGNPTTIVVNNPPAAAPSNVTVSGNSPVASISGAISGMRDFAFHGGSNTAYADSRPVAYVDNHPAVVADARSNPVANASNSGNQTVVVEGDKGDTIINEGDPVTINNVAYNTYFYDGRAYFVSGGTGTTIYIVIDGKMTPLGDLCPACTECRLRGDCPSWLITRCNTECPVGSTPVPPTAGPGTPVPPPTTPPTAERHNPSSIVGKKYDDPKAIEAINAMDKSK
jgi:hypothetical protein